jgi:hypothetical protein
MLKFQEVIPKVILSEKILHQHGYDSQQLRDVGKGK